MSTRKPLTALLADRTSAMQARRRALQDSEINAEAHELLDAVRALRLLVTMFDARHDSDAAGTVLAAAELVPPEGVPSVWGDDAFESLFSELSGLTSALDDFLALAAADLPPPPAERRAA